MVQKISCKVPDNWISHGGTFATAGQSTIIRGAQVEEHVLATDYDQVATKLKNLKKIAHDMSGIVGAILLPPPGGENMRQDVRVALTECLNELREALNKT